VEEKGNNFFSFFEKKKQSFIDILIEEGMYPSEEQNNYFSILFLKFCIHL
jgi:hypothetical protein